MSMDRVITFLRTYKRPSILILCLVVFIPIILLVSRVTRLNQLNKNNTTTPEPTQAPFQIIATSPKDGTENVYPGEIILSFTTNVPIVSKNVFTVSFSPQLPNSYQVVSAFPTTMVKLQIIGGLALGTTYTVSVHDSSGQIISSWSFTTSQKAAESSSKGVITQDQEIMNKYYPLFQYLPYYGTGFTIKDYSDRLTLEVLQTQSEGPSDQKSLDEIKQEVNAWIKSKGVDPATHTINYINAASLHPDK